MHPDLVYASIPLDRPQKNIRLIEILETSPQLRCRLIKVSLLNNSVFCALSYVWGASRYHEDIAVNDVSFSVTKSIAGALGNIQIHWAQAFPRQERHAFLCRCALYQSSRQYGERLSSTFNEGYLLFCSDYLLLFGCDILDIEYSFDN
jgi:hypothetical protein